MTSEEFLFKPTRNRSFLACSFCTQSGDLLKLHPGMKTILTDISLQPGEAVQETCNITHLYGFITLCLAC